MGLRWPNLGQPCLVKKPLDKQSANFTVIFGVNDSNIDHLQGNLFLQKLSDTREVFLNKFPSQYYSGLGPIEFDRVMNMDEWIGEENLIPLKIIHADKLVPSPWKHWPLMSSPSWLGWYAKKYYETKYARNITLQIESKYFNYIDVPELFNLVIRGPIEGTSSSVIKNGLVDINFHSVYIHDSDWHDFSFIHATDPHVALRNDFISEVIKNELGDGRAEGYINFNENFRSFIKRANNLHRQGELDFIILTGDLIDYIDIKRRFRKGYFEPMDNFELFRDLVVAWPKAEVVIGEELEVPLFTILGNHDYRSNPYPLIGNYNLDIDFSDYISIPALGFMIMGPIGFIGAICGLLYADDYFLYSSEQYKEFGLAKDEALAYEVGRANALKDKVPKFDEEAAVRHLFHLYDTHPKYTAIINPDIDYTINLGKHKIICLDSGPDEGNPSSDSLLELFYYKFYKTEKYESDQNFILGSPDSEGFSVNQVNFLNAQIKGSDGLVIVAFHAPMVNQRKYPPSTRDRESSHNKEFKRGKRDEERADDDLNLGFGVTDKRFEDFMESITRKIKGEKKAELILAGHTHRSVEYIVRKENGVFLFYHDYYIDNTIKGYRPWFRLSYNPQAYHPTLNESTSNTSNLKEWWKRHSPLHVQTLGIGPQNNGRSGFIKVNVKNDIISSIDRIYIKPKVLNSLRKVLENRKSHSVRNMLEKDKLEKNVICVIISLKDIFEWGSFIGKKQIDIEYYDDPELVKRSFELEIKRAKELELKGGAPP